jgi:hypothetical protein
LHTSWRMGASPVHCMGDGVNHNFSDMLCFK